MFSFDEIKKSFLAAVWLMFLTFPIMVIRVNTIDKIIEWRWGRMAMVGIGTFLLSFIWRYLIKKKTLGEKKAELGEDGNGSTTERIFKEPKIYIPSLVALSVFVLIFPFVFSLVASNMSI